MSNSLTSRRGFDLSENGDGVRDTSESKRVKRMANYQRHALPHEVSHLHVDNDNGAKANNTDLDLQQLAKGPDKVQDVVSGHNSSLIIRGGSSTRRGPSNCTLILTQMLTLSTVIRSSSR